METVIGVNTRANDNLYQLMAIVICACVGAGVGALYSTQSGKTNLMGGMIMGGIAGLLVGLFGSGIFLMIYRPVVRWRAMRRAREHEVERMREN